MANLTITVDDDLLKQARLRARELGSCSIDVLIREYLQALGNPRVTREEAIRSLQSLADRTQSGSEGRRIRRDDLYERS